MQDDFKKAFEDYKLMILYRDSLLNEQNTKKTVQTQMQYEFDKKESATKADQDKKNAVAQSDARRKNIVLVFVICSLVLLVLFLIFLFNRFLVIQKQKTVIEKQKAVVEEKQKEILDSIRYAKKIQQSLLPTEKFIDKNLTRLN